MTTTATIPALSPVARRTLDGLRAIRIDLQAEIAAMRWDDPRRDARLGELARVIRKGHEIGRRAAR
jgi:hypothetical protein